MDLIYKYYYNINRMKVSASLPEIRVSEEVMKEVLNIFLGKERNTIEE